MQDIQDHLSNREAQLAASKENVMSIENQLEPLKVISMRIMLYFNTKQKNKWKLDEYLG